MAVSINRYDEFPLHFGQANINLASDTFKLELYNSTHSFDKNNQNRSQISANALATGNGYTNPGQDLSTVSWTEAAGTATFNADDVVWNAVGGSIGPAAHGVLYDDDALTPAADLLAYSIDFDGDQTAGDGTPFQVTWNASGIFTVA